MTIVISSVGTKGGTGKTSLVKHFGIIKSMEQKKKVLMIDLCQNSDIATQLGYNRRDFQFDTYDWVSEQVPFKAVVQHDDETGIDFIPASNLVDKIVEYSEKKSYLSPKMVLKKKVDEIKERYDYDYILFDNHPTETTGMLIMSLLASDIALVPTVLSSGSVEAALRTIEIIQGLQSEGFSIEFGVVPMNVDLKMGAELNQLREMFTQRGVKFMSPTRYTVVVARASLDNEVIKHNNPYMDKLMEDYRVLSKEIDAMMLVRRG